MTGTVLRQRDAANGALVDANEYWLAAAEALVTFLYIRLGSLPTAATPTERRTAATRGSDR
jgi:hypothetical protein